MSVAFYRDNFYTLMENYLEETEKEAGKTLGEKINYHAARGPYKRNSHCAMFKLPVQTHIKKMKIPIRLNYLFSFVPVPIPFSIYLLVLTRVLCLSSV